MKNNDFSFISQSRIALEKCIVGLCILLIRGYQRWISPLFPPVCRFHPTCSSYAIEAIQKFGVWKGGFLAIARILRCHPFHPGGVDPVPEQFSSSLCNCKGQKNHDG